MIRWLLAHNANPNVGTRNGTIPVSRAVASAPFRSVKLLFGSGGPTTVKHSGLVGHAIHRTYSEYLEVLDYLLRNGCQSDINELEYEDRPDLHEQID